MEDSHPPEAPPEYGQPPAARGMPMPALHVQGGSPSQWSTGLYDCFSDVPNCCLTCWCPCITFGKIAEIVDKGSTSNRASGSLYGIITVFTGCSCIYSYLYRSRMRTEYMLPETPCGDCLVHCFCEACALCQEYRELQHRGFDMSLGWEGNMEKQNQNKGQGITAAPYAGGMNR
ncbi:protein PLANT CADMIUM RESISTANCE 2-like [Primulina huaijiensis]|uniref:protein PLANT CADMIUM RESISTANCE 2-like n=1 Tax=Primulina huaijiensis TaxID=1492673 RepID=UPI003CC79250